MLQNLENLKINAHDLSELETMGINKDLIVDAVDWINSLVQSMQDGNKEWSKRALDGSYKAIIRILRKMDYELELEQDIEDVVKAGKKYIAAMIEGDAFNIDFERIGFNYQLTKFKIEHPEFKW